MTLLVMITTDMVVRMWNREGVAFGYLWTENGKVKNTPSVDYLLKSPYEVWEPRTGNRLTVNDGDRFLQALTVMFKGIGDRAELLQTDQVPDGVL